MFAHMRVLCSCSVSCSCPGVPVPGDSSLTSAGKWGIFGVVFGSVLFVLRALLYCCTHRRTPSLGSRILSSHVVADFQNGWRKWLPLVLVIFVLCMKLPALFIDEWDQSSSNGVTTKYGVYQSRTTADGQSEVTQKYSDRCQTAPFNTGGELTMCRTLRVAGAFTLIAAIWSIVASFVYMFFDFQRGGMAVHGVTLWRLSGLMQMGSLGSYWFWLISAHRVIYDDDSQATVSASFILFLVSWIVELGLLVFLRRAVASTAPTGHGGILGVIASQPVSPSVYSRMPAESHGGGYGATTTAEAPVPGQSASIQPGGR
jgi:hypothetical protein